MRDRDGAASASRRIARPRIAPAAKWTALGQGLAQQASFHDRFVGTVTRRGPNELDPLAIGFDQGDVEPRRARVPLIRPIAVIIIAVVPSADAPAPDAQLVFKTSTSYNATARPG